MSGYVYLIGPVGLESGLGGGAVKIGVTVDLERRLAELQTGCPFELKVLSAGVFSCPYVVEEELHRRYRKCKIRNGGEWFNLPQEEIRKLTEELGKMPKSQPRIQKPTQSQSLYHHPGYAGVGGSASWAARRDFKNHKRAQFPHPVQDWLKKFFYKIGIG
jgi:hypothetical protein